MRPESHDSPIFIVGASRSGTELMRTTLNQHPSVFISPETHYFDDLRLRIRASEDLDETGVRACEDYFLAALHLPYGHGGRPHQAPLSRHSLREAAAKIGNGPDSFFEAFCRLNAQRQGAQRWGEKTPRHVFCLKEILAAFPASKVICMVRDPRAAINSYRAWTNRDAFDQAIDQETLTALQHEQQRVRRSYNLLIASLLWSGSVQAAVAARKQFTSERVFIQSYEELVLDPRLALAQLTAWLSLDIHPAMLNAPIINSSFSSFQSSAGFVTQFISRWRTSLSRREIAVIQAICARAMKSCGYKIQPAVSPFWPLLCECLKLPAALTNAALANRSRIGQIGLYLRRRIHFATASIGTRQP